MPKVTAIKIQSKIKDRCNVFVDNEFYCALSLETVLKYQLKVGDDIDKKEFIDILSEDEKTEALNKAVNYLSNRLKTKREIKNYLMGKGYSENTVYYCIDKLKEYKYIDDEEYSRRYIESVSKNQGKRLTEYKLMMKGVRKDDIAVAYEKVNVDSKENALSVARKHIKNKEITKENLAKTYRYLIGRGFSYEDAGYAIEKLKKED